VNVKYFASIVLNKFGTENSHKTCQNNEVYLFLINKVYQCGIKVFSRAIIAVVDDGGRNAGLRSTSEAIGICLVTDNAAHLVIGVDAIVNNGLEIAAVSGN
jgi:hypothetical protein